MRTNELHVMRAMPLFAVRAERPGPRVGTVVEACVAARRAVERDVRDGIWPAILGIAGRCRQPPGLKCQKGGVPAAALPRGGKPAAADPVAEVC
jgi:hypothetical protein